MVPKNFSSRVAVQLLTTQPLMRLQVKSYEEFLQKDVPTARRKMTGLQAVFHSIFPIYDFNKTVSLEFVSYSLEEPKYTVKECRQRGLSYEAPLKLSFVLFFTM
jgi:DNA-directed RNA polymerase subunit beta